MEQFISYSVGCMFGRYSLDKEGLILANQGETIDDYSQLIGKQANDCKFLPDDDNIIPVLDNEWFDDDIVSRFYTFLKVTFGEKNFNKNLAFIEEQIGMDMRKYFTKEFYSDHIKRYKKRPIYWMFSSGKKQGFKALIYMHRYNSNTLAKMNASYFQPATTVLRTKISEIEKQISIASERDKVQLERTRFSLIEQLNEAIEYGQVLDYMANKYISIDLDDGVKVNYEKFQKVEINTSNGKVKKDLLIPIN